jgi:hypothetical protein
MKKAKQPPQSKIDFESDSSKPLSDAELSQVANLAQQLRDVDYTIARLTEELENAQEIRDRVASADLPALMDQVGMKEFTLKDGAKITVKPIVKAALPAESAIAKCKEPEKRSEMRDRFERGLKYLQKNGAGALVKNIVKAELGKDSIKLARQACAALRALGIKSELARGVHPHSLTAWVKERLEAGKPVDHDLFAVYSGNIATITPPKQTTG